MRFEGKSPNFVFFDLSKLEASTSAAFLDDLSQRSGAEALPPHGCCHWILAPQRSADLLAAEGPGPAFLRRRLAQGDRLFCTNPTGFDWNHLFPSEAEAEIRALEALVRHEVFLFLESTPEPPDWLSSFESPVFRASPDGLVVLQGAQQVSLAWASRDRRPHRGVWWIIPGQVLLGSLPEGPWADLPATMPSLLPRPRERENLRPGVSAPTPGEKKALYAISLHRRGSPPPLLQSVFFRSSDYPGLGTKDAVDFEEALGGIRKRSLVANMQGQTDLAESGIKVRFQGGRLIRLEDSLSDSVLCRGAETSLDWGGTRHRFTVNSAFSFEGDFSWGLRQSLMLFHDDLAEPGRAIFDYYFVEESREFFVAATVRWPRWKAPTTVTRWAPLELTLFDQSWGEPLTTRAVWPDGRATDRIHRRGVSGVLAGTDFVLGAGKRALVLGFPQNQAPRPHLLPWRLVPEWGHSRLVVNPEGGQGPRPSTSFEGIEEHFSFYLTLPERAKLPFSVTRKQAVELIPPYVVDADEYDPRS